MKRGTSSVIVCLAKLLFFIACIACATIVRASENLKVEISGIEGELLDNVNTQLGIAQLARQTALISLPSADKGDSEITEASIRRLHRAAKAEIRGALQPFGYYAPTIDSNLQRTDQGWVASYQIDPGEATIVDTVDLGIQGEGSDNTGLKKVLEATRFGSGQRLQHSHYEETKAALIKAALQAGYLDARFTRSEIRVDPRHNRADIALMLDTGHRYYFGDIHIDQQILDPSFLSGFVEIERGMPVQYRSVTVTATDTRR